MEAIIAALLSAGLVLFISPWLDRRAQRRERWEQDLLRFGETFTTDLSVAVDAARNAWVDWDVLWQVAAEKQWDTTLDAFVEEEQRAREAGKAPTDALTELVKVRLDWLARRVSAAQPDADRFYIVWRVYSMMHPERVWGWTDDNRARVTEQWAREPKDRELVTKALLELTATVAPPTRLRGRLRMSRWRLGRAVRARIESLRGRSSGRRKSWNTQGSSSG